MSELSDEIIQEVNERLDIQRLVEAIGYRTEKVQDTGDAIRGFCPIHGERVFRTLSIDKATRTFRCSRANCAGAAGGNLIQLYALAREFDVEDALRDLVEHFSIPVSLPPDRRRFDRHAKAADNHLDHGKFDEAESAYADLMQVCEAEGDLEGVGRVHGRLARLFVQREDIDRALEHARAMAGALPDDALPHRVTGECLLAVGNSEGALDEFMAEADLCEAVGDYEGAFDAYLRVGDLELDIVDVEPHIERACGGIADKTRAAEHLTAKAEALAASNRMTRAAQVLELGTNLAPEDHKLRARFAELAAIAEPAEEWAPKVVAAAAHLLKAGMPQETVLALQMLLATQPNTPSALDLLAAAFDGQGLADDASATRVRAAQLLGEEGRTSEAVGMLEQLLAAAPEHVEALETLASIETARRNPAAAFAALHRLASSRRSRGEFRQAVEICGKLLRDEPESVEVRELRAIALEDMAKAGDEDAREEASREFETLGDQLARDTTGHRSAAYFERAASLGKPRAELIFKIAREYLRMREPGHARENVIKASEILVEQGQPEIAVIEAEQFAELLPEETDLARYVANLYARCGDNPTAVARLRRLADFLFARGDSVRSESVLGQALELDPECIEVLDQMARLQRGRGADDEYAATLTRIANVHEAAGNTEKAVATLRTFIDKRPTDTAAVERLVRLNELLGRGDEAHNLRLRLADIARQAGDHQREAAVLRAALEQTGEDEATMVRLCECEFARGEIEAGCEVACSLAAAQSAAGRDPAARATLSKALATAPDNLPVNRRLFDLLLKLKASNDAVERGTHLVGLLRAAGQIDEAAEAYERIVACVPKNKPLSLSLKRGQADFLRDIGRTAEAGEKLFALAHLHEERNRSDEAEALLVELQDLVPSHVEGRRALVALYRKAEKPAKAEEQLGRLAELQHAAGDFEAAVTTVREALAAPSASFSPRRLLIGFFRGRDMAAEAVTELHVLADGLRSAGSETEAVAAEAEAVEIAPNDTAARRRLADSLRRRGDLSGAGTQLEELARVQSADGHHDAALAAISELLEFAPEQLSARRQRADIYAKMGDKSRAKEELRQVAVQSLVLEARASREAGDFGAQVLALKQALTHAGEDAAILGDLVDAEFAQGNIEGGCEASRRLAAVLDASGSEAEARSALAAALAKAPDHVETNRELFAALRKAGQASDAVARGLHLAGLLGASRATADAAAVYNEVVACDPQNLDLKAGQIDFLRQMGLNSEAVELTFALARLHEQNDDTAQAEGLLAGLVSADRDEVRAREELVQLFGRLGATNRAVEMLRELADTHQRLGDDATAVATIGRARKAAPNDSGVRRQLVRYHREASRQADALAEMHALADLHLRLGETAESLEAEREAVAMVPDDILSHRRLADALMRECDLPNAVAELEQLALLLSEQEQPAQALATLDELLDLEPSRTSARIQRAELYAATGDSARALDEYRAISSLLASAAPAITVTTSSQSATPLPPNDGRLQIVKEYDFESFVVGANNDFAHATALAVARAPARDYNPLFIHSDVGLGKTHLVNAIANHILNQNPNARIIYTNSEDFTDELVTAIQTNEINHFRTRYKTLDLLIIDDVQFLAGKQRAQEEFFHIFNALFQAKRQIVATSDRPPMEIGHLESRLLSRFGGGVIVDIGTPAIETRIAILNRAATAEGLEVDPAIPRIIAERINSNVRELKAALKQVIAMHRFQGLEITEDSVNAVLDTLRPQHAKEAGIPGEG